jgi:DNA-binding NarL/FixJ family response regulator
MVLPLATPDTAPGLQPERTLQILTVDDQAPFREAAAILVASTPGFEIAAETADGESAVRLARELDPDMVLLDVRMDGIDGIETASRLTRDDPTRLVVLVSSADVGELSQLAERAGVAAIVRKHWLTPRFLGGLWIALRRR